MDKSQEKEKLMDLIVDAKRADPETGSFTEWLAGFLLDHGVMVPADDGPGADRLRELIQADREGRCLVLACMPGESVFVVVSVPESGIYAVVETKPQGLHEILTFTRSLGKTVFRTREEAEAALAKMRAEGCE